MQLTEKYRPKDFGEVIGQPKAVTVLERFRDNGTLAGRAYWISGKSGQGKTSIANIIAAMVSDELHKVEADAGKITAGTVEQWRQDAMYGRPMTCQSRCYVINEAHGLRKDAIRSLLVFLENLGEHSTVIFTTTVDGQLSFEDCQLDASPLLSRCTRLELQQRGLNKLFAAQAKQIAELEGLDGQAIEKYERLSNDEQGNMRAILQRIEAGEMLS